MHAAVIGALWACPLVSFCPGPGPGAALSERHLDESIAQEPEPEPIPIQAAPVELKLAEFDETKRPRRLKAQKKLAFVQD